MDYTDIQNLKFLLFDVLSISEILKLEKHLEFDEGSVEILLDAAKDLADTELHPFIREFDENPAHFEDGKVIIHPQIGKLIRLFGENGWIGSHFAPKHGGMHMPHLLEAAASHIFLAANNHMPGYTALTTGAANLITTFGSDPLIGRFVPYMVAGKWMGTMCLTEPEAGSSLGDLRTEAIPGQQEGSYRIRGQKIFISGGDHEYADNFVHMVLARIQGAPAGSKGISLFVVPKFRLSDGGQLVSNDVITAGDYQKLGQRGYCTTHLIFGEQDDCRGWLVGEANMGLKYMFQMMNEARLEVGMIAASTATAAYHASLQYAKERFQGRRMTPEESKSIQQTLIINHPDVRRMLLFQKAVSEGSLALLLHTYKYYDQVKNTTGEEQHKYQLLLDLLTPVAKSYPSDRGIQSVSQGIQVLGGYGYTRDYILEQYYRDIRITALYEGTSGIQALDLLGRKATADNGQALMVLMEVINQSIQEAREYDEFKDYALQLEKGLAEVQKVLEYLLPYAFQKQYERFLADASLFLDLTGHLLVAWQWLRIATAAKKALKMDRMKFEKSFYLSKIHTMRFFFHYELPAIYALSETIRKQDFLTIKETEDFVF